MAIKMLKNIVLQIKHCILGKGMILKYTKISFKAYKTRMVIQVKRVR
jgi:hypothetical protein